MSIIYMSRKIVDPVAQEIERQGLEGVPDRDWGTELAVQYCDDLLRKVRGGTGKGVCGTYLINQIINSLPIYFIIAHSSVDVDLNQIGSKKRKLDQSTSLFKQLPIYANLSNSKFLINTTTVGGWGLLDKDATCIPLDHILRENGRIIRDYLFKPEVSDVGRIGIYKTFETKQGMTEEEGTVQFPPLYNLPGTNYIDKVHQFGGKKLTGGGFGIIKVTSNSTNNAFEPVQNWQHRQQQSEEVLNEQIFKHNVYFLTDKGGDIGGGKMAKKQRVTPKDLALWDLIRNGWEEKNYMNDNGTTSPMWASNIKISDIIETGGPGIYISLSCSEYNFVPKEIPYHTGLAITQAFRTIGDFNRAQWNAFTETLRMSTQNTLSSSNPSNTVTQTGLLGFPNYLDLFKNQKSGGKKRGKRRRTKRRKKRTRQRRRKKTRKKKKRIRR
jgi:hypothetical protein